VDAVSGGCEVWRFSSWTRIVQVGTIGNCSSFLMFLRKGFVWKGGFFFFASEGWFELLRGAGGV